MLNNIVHRYLTQNYIQITQYVWKVWIEFVSIVGPNRSTVCISFIMN
jgi:hypothetical protein